MSSDYSKFLIEITSLEKDEKLGTGSFGSVYSGKWTGKGGGIRVAIKRIKLHHRFKPEKHLNEFIMMLEIQYPLVVQVFGYAVSKDEKSLYIVMELMEEDLFNYLHRKKLSLLEKVDLMIKITQCLHFLHGCEPSIIHRDVKSMNFLLSNNGNVIKITDFGIAKSNLSTFLVSAGGKGTFLWMAPELFKSGKARYTTHSDVYALAMTFFEVLNGEPPFFMEIKEDIINPSLSVSVLDFINNGKRPKFSSNVPRELVEFVGKCWCTNPADRLSTREILDWLGSYKENLTERSEFGLTTYGLTNREERGDEVEVITEKQTTLSYRNRSEVPPEREKGFVMENNNNNPVGIKISKAGTGDPSSIRVTVDSTHNKVDDDAVGKTKSIDDGGEFAESTHNCNVGREEAEKTAYKFYWGLEGENIDRRQTFNILSKIMKEGGKLGGTSLFYIGMIYKLGYGVEKDVIIAREYFQKACEVFEQSSLEELQPRDWCAMGMMLLLGICFKKDKKRGLKLVEKAANEEHCVVAIYRLAHCYRVGSSFGVKNRDRRRCVEFYSKAVDAGFPSAMFDLGFLFSKGYYGLKKDEKRAFELTLQAAERGVRDAMFQVGVSCEKGSNGIQKSMVEAKKWFRKAAEMGQENSIQKLEFLRQTGNSFEKEVVSVLKGANRSFLAANNDNCEIM